MFVTWPSSDSPCGSWYCGAVGGRNHLAVTLSSVWLWLPGRVAPVTRGRDATSDQYYPTLTMGRDMNMSCRHQAIHHTGHQGWGWTCCHGAWCQPSLTRQTGSSVTGHAIMSHKEDPRPKERIFAWSGPQEKQEQCSVTTASAWVIKFRQLEKRDKKPHRQIITDNRPGFQKPPKAFPIQWILKM